MLLPPSLPPVVISRAFRATNGDFGIAPAEAPGFLDACEVDFAEISGGSYGLSTKRGAPPGPRKLQAIGLA